MLEHPTPRSAQPRPDGRAAGLAIVCSSALSIVAIAHHPAIRHADSAADAIGAIARLAAVDRVVHGTMIAFVAVQLFGMIVFCMRRGLDKQTVAGGLMAYAIGTGALIAAAMVDGFLVPAIGEQFAGAPADGMRLAVQLLGLCGAAIQIATKLGLVAIAAALVAWSAGLLRENAGRRLAGAAGLVAALTATGVLAFGGQLGPASLTIVVAGQAVWYVTVGALLVRDDL